MLASFLGGDTEPPVFEIVTVVATKQAAVGLEHRGCVQMIAIHGQGMQAQSHLGSFASVQQARQPSHFHLVGQPNYLKVVMSMHSKVSNVLFCSSKYYGSLDIFSG